MHDAGQAVDLGDDEDAARWPSASSPGERLGEPLRRRAHHGERVAHLVRDRRGQLAERRQLLALGHARAGRVERSGCGPLAPPRLDGVSEEEAHDCKRASEPRHDEPADVAAGHLERGAEPAQGERVGDRDADPDRRAPPREAVHAVVRCKPGATHPGRFWLGVAGSRNAPRGGYATARCRVATRTSVVDHRVVAVGLARRLD